MKEDSKQSTADEITPNLKLESLKRMNVMWENVIYARSQSMISEWRTFLDILHSEIKPYCRRMPNGELILNELKQHQRKVDEEQQIYNASRDYGENPSMSDIIQSLVEYQESIWEIMYNYFEN